jgi:chromosome segregation ATPase
MGEGHIMTPNEDLAKLSADEPAATKPDATEVEAAVQIAESLRIKLGTEPKAYGSHSRALVILAAAYRHATRERDEWKAKITDWDALSTAIQQWSLPDELRTVQIWPNDWHQDCGFVAFTIEQLRRERDEAKLALSATEAQVKSLEASTVQLQSQLSAALKEIERLKLNIGCARNQGSTQFCAEAVAALKELEEAKAFEAYVQKFGDYRLSYSRSQAAASPIKAE